MIIASTLVLIKFIVKAIITDSSRVLEVNSMNLSVLAKLLHRTYIAIYGFMVNSMHHTLHRIPPMQLLIILHILAIIIILILHLSVCPSVVRAGGHGKRTEQKNISFSSSLDLDDT